MSSPSHDVAIVGGGIIGLATAYRLLEQLPSLDVVVLEKERELALQQTGRNSGVIHSGIYYRPGSLKARLCREGKAALERFCDERGIPYERCGKVVVAVHRSELSRLQDLFERGRANGVEGLTMIGPEELSHLEPNATGIAGLYSPGTGIVDFRRVALALAQDIRARGGQIRVGCRVRTIRNHGDHRLITTDGPSIRARSVITCGGLQSDRLAGAARSERIVPFRGSYVVLQARGLVRNLLYPVPDPALPFLGVHFTRRVTGEVWVGPNAVVALAREGSRRWDMDPGDVASTLSYAGFWRLARRHWRTGVDEVVRDLALGALARECRRYLPDIRTRDLVRGPFGVRAQSVRLDGSLVDDFSLQEASHVIHVRNAPSPAATACLAIAEVLAGRAKDRFGL